MSEMGLTSVSVSCVQAEGGEKHIAFHSGTAQNKHTYVLIFQQLQTNAVLCTHNLLGDTEALTDFADECNTPDIAKGRVTYDRSQSNQ